TVFFELNGQPRSVRVVDASQAALHPPKRKVEQGVAGQVGAPMPGTVSIVNVAIGQKVARGDTLVTLEAMKMETAVRADGDGVVTDVVTRAGLQVDVDDLLVVLAPEAVAQRA